MLHGWYTVANSYSRTIPCIEMSTSEHALRLPDKSLWFLYSRASNGVAIHAKASRLQKSGETDREKEREIEMRSLAGKDDGTRVCCFHIGKDKPDDLSCAPPKALRSFLRACVHAELSLACRVLSFSAESSRNISTTTARVPTASQLCMKTSYMYN